MSAVAARYSTAYLISGLCTGSLSAAFIANATAYGVAANAGALVRSMIPCFALFSALLCVVTHVTCSGSGSSILAKRRQLYLAQLATTCVCLMLLLAGPMLFAVTANATSNDGNINCSIPNRTYRSILIDEIVLAAVMAAALTASTILGWLDGGRLAIFAGMFGGPSRRSAGGGGLVPSGESGGKAEPPLSLGSQEHRITAANKKRRPPSGLSGPAAAAAATAAASNSAGNAASDNTPAASEGAKNDEAPSATSVAAEAKSGDIGSNKGVKFADEVNVDPPASS